MNQKDWTIMVYMAGDNNLSVDMAYALQQIKDVVETNDDLNLFVYYDGFSPAIPTLYCDFSDAKNPKKYYRSHKIKNKLYPVDAEFDENSAAAFSVINFVDWCVNKVEYTAEDDTVMHGRKANNYALIFSGHSFGFQSMGLMKDENSDYSMTLRKIRWLLERVTGNQEQVDALAEKKHKFSGKEWSPEKWAIEKAVVIGEKLQILGFDSCVMSMLEVGYQFSRVANTMVASEGSVPNAGWSYAELFGQIAGGSGGSSGQDTARQFVEDFILKQDKFTLGGVSVDMAAWDLTVLPQIEAPFKALVENLLSCFADPKSVLYKQMKRAVLESHWNCQTYMMEQNVDLGDFCRLLIEEVSSLKEELAGQTFAVFDQIVENAGRVLSVIDECIILSGFSGGKYQYSSGISLFFPWSCSSYAISQQVYDNLLFVKFTEAGQRWNEFIAKFVTDVSFRKARPINEAGERNIAYLSYVYEEQPESQNRLFNQLNDNSGDDVIHVHENDLVAASTANTNAAVTDAPENGTHKIPEDGTHKIPEDGTHKIPENGTHKIPENGTHKIPENGTHKMFGELGLFLEEFMNYKNIETPWNLSGFSRTDMHLNFKIRHNLTGTNIHVPPGE